MEKNRKVSKIIARWTRINQDDDENEERRKNKRRCLLPMDFKFKKQCIVNLSNEKKEGNEM
jgi:hypothetical protein